MWRLPQSSCLKINGVRRGTTKSERTADQTLSNKNTCTPTAARASPPPARELAKPGRSLGSRLLPAGLGRARGGPSRVGAPAPRRPGTKGRPAPARHARPEPRWAPDSPRRMNSTARTPGKSPARTPRGVQVGDRRTRSPPSRGPRGPGVQPSEGQKGGAPDCGTRGAEGEEEAGPPHVRRRSSGGDAPSGSGRRGESAGGPGEPPWKRAAAAPVAHSPASRNHPLPW